MAILDLGAVLHVIIQGVWPAQNAKPLPVNVNLDASMGGTDHFAKVRNVIIPIPFLT